MEKCKTCITCMLRHDCSGQHQFNCRVYNFMYYTPDDEVVGRNPEREVQKYKDVVNKMAREVADTAMNEIMYEGKTIHKWIELLLRTERQNERLGEVIAEMENALERVKDVTHDDLNDPDTDFYVVVEKAMSDGIEMLRGLEA